MPHTFQDIPLGGKDQCHNSREAVKVIVGSLNRLSCEGVLGLRAVVTSVKGDGKFIFEIVSAKANPNADQICVKCEATRGLRAPMTDLSEDAMWRQLPHTDIWWAEPAIASLSNWSLNLVCPDLMHTYHLGMGRDVCSSVLVVCLRSGLFAGNNVPRFHQSSKECFQFPTSGQSS